MLFHGIGVYKITSPTGRIYVGSSKDLKIRIRDYKSLHCKSQTKLYNSFVKYGVNNHLFEVICYCDIDNLYELEVKYGIEYDVLSKRNLNLQLPKVGNNYKIYSEEALISRSLRSSGRKHSEETKRKISEKNKGNKYGLGHIVSDEVKKRISESQKGNKYNLGKKYSIERINKAKNNRLPLSAEAKNKMGPEKKLILNTETGIFYIGLIEASMSINMKKGTLWAMLSNKNKNKTSLIYV